MGIHMIHFFFFFENRPVDSKGLVAMVYILLYMLYFSRQDFFVFINTTHWVLNHKYIYGYLKKLYMGHIGRIVDLVIIKFFFFFGR